MTATTGPKYQRLMDQIRSRITSGEYPVGSRIPSTNELAKSAGMSVPVVRRAVGQLQADGVLIGHAGDGVYVEALPSDTARERQDVEVLRDHLAAFRRELHDLTGHVEEIDVRTVVGRIEANLIDLYGKLGFDYPQDASHDGAKAAAGRGRSRR